MRSPGGPPRPRRPSWSPRARPTSRSSAHRCPSRQEPVDEAISADYIITASRERHRRLQPVVAPAAAVKGAAASRPSTWGSRVRRRRVDLTAGHRAPGRHRDPAGRARVGRPRLAAGDLLIDTTTAATKHLSGGLERCRHVREDRQLDHEGGGHLQAQCPHRQLSRLRRVSCRTSMTRCPSPCSCAARGATGVGAALDGPQVLPKPPGPDRAQFEQSHRPGHSCRPRLRALALAVVIALIGIVNTLMLSVFERTHEIGLLRAVGCGPQVRAMIRSEASSSPLRAIIGWSSGRGSG